MLAGLIFATEDAEDRPDTLAATLPFGGTSLIEYQARLLAAAGATHLLVAVSRVTPALLGAISRIGGRGVTIDVVRSAQEASARLHPLANVIVVADGLVTTDAVIEWIGSENHEVLLVGRDGDGTPGVERIDASHSWAGLARVPASRLAAVATMPDDYDFQSTLLRHSAQAGAGLLLLPPGTARTRHGVERSAAALLRRSKSVLAALGDRRTAWVDRFVFTPITGWTLPHLVARTVPGFAMMAAATLVTAAAIASFLLLSAAVGLVLSVLACAILSTGSMLSWLRAEDARARLQERAIAAVAALAVALTSAMAWRGSADLAAPALAAVTIGLAALLDRLTVARRRWWPTPAAHLIVALPFVALGQAMLGLTATSLYAFAALATAIEAVREKA